MNIEEWTRIGNLEYGINYKFDYIRDEIRFLISNYRADEETINDKIECLLRTDFSEIFDGLTYRDVVDVDCGGNQSSYVVDNYELVSYNVEIYFHKSLTKRIYEYYFDKYPDQIMRHLNQM